MSICIIVLGHNLRGLDHLLSIYEDEHLLSGRCSGSSVTRQMWLLLASWIDSNSKVSRHRLVIWVLSRDSSYHSLVCNRYHNDLS